MEFKTGSADSTLDDKGRVSIPVRFRDQYQGKLVITCGSEQCVWIMTESVWEHFTKAILNSTDISEEEREDLVYKHIYRAHQEEVELDKAGRIAIPSKLRDYADLTKDCTVVSAENRLDIWDRSIFDETNAKKDAIARAAMNKLGIRKVFKTGQE